MIKIEITEEEFNEIKIIDFYDGSTMFMNIVNNISSKIIIPFWGVYLDEGVEKISSFDLKDNQLNVVKGFSELIFKEVLEFNLKMKIYNGNKIVKGENGSDLIFKKCWKNTNSKPKYSYKFESYNSFPESHCEVEVMTNNKVLFFFNEQDCVSYENYLSLPQSESFFGWKNESHRPHFR